MAGQLRSQLFSRAMAGDATVLIFLAKVYLGLKEPKYADSEVNVTSPPTRSNSQSRSNRSWPI